MKEKEEKEIDVRKITKLGTGTVIISIPQEILQSAEMNVGDYVKISSPEKGKILMEVIR